MKRFTSSFLILLFLSASACSTYHGVAPATRVAERDARLNYSRAYSMAERGQDSQQSSAIPVVLIPAGIGLKELLIGGGAILLGGIIINVCIQSGACAPKNVPKDENDASVNKPPLRTPPDERCKKIAKDCREQCLETLPTPDTGFKFWNCVNAAWPKIVARQGCTENKSHRNNRIERQP